MTTVADGLSRHLDPVSQTRAKLKPKSSMNEMDGCSSRFRQINGMSGGPMDERREAPRPNQGHTLFGWRMEKLRVPQ